MDIRPSPIPGWAWDLIETVERGERIAVKEINWRSAARGPYKRMIARAKSGTIKAPSEVVSRAIDSWEKRQESVNAGSSGHADKGRMAFTIVAGTDSRDARMVVLHEIAHLMAFYGVYHERQWVKIVARLYTKYGGPETVAWAIAHERRGGEPLKRILRLHQANCDECQYYRVEPIVKAVRGLVADLKAMGVA
jgi:predicted metal-dependent hydrolase